MVPCSPARECDGASPDCDARPQRAGAAVAQVGHREGAEQAPVLQSLPGAAGPSAAKGWVLIWAPRPSRRARRQPSKPGCKQHDASLSGREPIRVKKPAWPGARIHCQGWLPRTHSRFTPSARRPSAGLAGPVGLGHPRSGLWRRGPLSLRVAACGLAARRWRTPGRTRRAFPPRLGRAQECYVRMYVPSMLAVRPFRPESSVLLMVLATVNESR